jgi:hypothetical protein
LIGLSGDIRRTPARALVGNFMRVFSTLDTVIAGDIRAAAD